MAPSPNRNMNQRDIRPSAPVNPYRRANQQGMPNQNGQQPPMMQNDRLSMGPSGMQAPSTGPSSQLGALQTSPGQSPDRSIDSSGNPGRQGPAWGAPSTPPPPPQQSFQAAPADGMQSSLSGLAGSGGMQNPAEPGGGIVAQNNRYKAGPNDDFRTQQPSTVTPPQQVSLAPSPGMPAPSMPEAARQQTSGPQPQASPYARQSMPMQSQLQRKITPNVS
jgi:hypothetical protein